MKLISPDNQDNTDYLTIIRSIDAKHVYIPNELLPERQLMIRHDVDHDIDKALIMAEYEHDHGIKATYFLQPDALYFHREKDSFITKVKRFDHLGHFLGLHNNYLAMVVELVRDGHYEDPMDIDLRGIIRKDLNWFRSIGTFVVGTSSHGSLMCKQHNIINYEIWNECPEASRKADFEHPRFNLRDFRLQYEAYFLQRDAYLTDTGHTWRGGIRSGIGPFEVPHQDIAMGAIEAFNRMDSGVMQLLVHPCWWKMDHAS